MIGAGRFWKLPQAIAARRDIGWTAKGLLSRLLDYAGASGVAWPSLRTLAVELGVGDRAVTRASQSLVKARLIRIEKGSGRRSSRYRILRPFDGSAVETTSQSNGVAPSKRRQENPVAPSSRRRSAVRSTTELDLDSDLPKKTPSSPAKNRVNDWGFACRYLTTAELRTDEFRAAWLEWVKYRGRSKLKPQTVKRQIARLEKFGHDDAIASIEQSITNSWAGLFEPKSSGPTSARTRAETQRRDRAQLEFAEADLGVPTL